MWHDLVCVWSISRVLGFVFLFFFACVSVLKSGIETCPICGFVSEEEI